ncbi:cell division protein FtsA [Candidatus Adlerbacteria bacterium RIFCSPLOWO2_01_FULL_51_16]|uniref:Cell division protein FtsA n=1 Tax=Candidatus Adlerbacteria bacterium RIFCSPLOWO2_01_FULL_51_16 TaxID=1797243 RepID=A0A1F4XGL4_9BACT|nr:MAG: cell division protein FtsA [Candidatus Adlerbacteria bacterium RIFCSPLOWO2_01_FULL_51_16]
MPNYVTGIDVGTYHVKVVIAERPANLRETPRILGTGYAESRGLKHGYIISISEVSRSIGAAVAQASKAARVRVKKAYLGIGGVGLDEALSRGDAVVERGDSEITGRDIPRAIDASKLSLPPAAVLNRKIIHTIPLRYYVDGGRVLGRSPVGMKGMRLSVDTLFVTCLERHVNDLVEATEAAGVEVEDVVASPIAASFVALSKMQKRVGCILANIGAETLSTVVFEDTMPISVKVFPMGAADITNDIALGLRISPEEAEQLKQGAVLGAPYSKRKVEDIITRRVSDMFKLVEAHLKKIGKDELLPAGVILTGGGSSVATMSDLAKAVLRLPSKTATLADGPAAKMQLRDGSWAVAYGLTIWGFTQGDGLETHEGSGIFDIFSYFFRWFRKFLP